MMINVYLSLCIQVCGALLLLVAAARKEIKREILLGSVARLPRGCYLRNTLRSSEEARNVVGYYIKAAERAERVHLEW